MNKIANASPTAKKRPKVLSQAAAVDAIRQAIVTGQLIPGQRLVEDDVSQLLGAISRNTVRAALTVLVHEGLVLRIDNKGARVRTVAPEEGVQITEMRSLVEGHCAARAAERITDDEIVELQQLAKQMKRHVKQGNTVGFIETKELVVDTYVRIASHPIAKEILGRLRDRNAAFRSNLAYRPGRPQVSLPYWLKTIEAICNRDPNAAQMAVHIHMENVIQIMKSMDGDKHQFGIRAPA
ncbi:GntR family transcriptional regulator [Novosphingobium flavum]|uniref:GntR family transcriptional regulator n=1 Tax=Novosphingobium flavum TaxID=1778672 RepID=A0A7X1FUN1_9SPHN|nr:GntR family transcriptional regulator [Novosphingobium flavum]MBC2666652.1 GntR family transcriptional regulator [Novosphingobium flavum]